MLTAALAVPYAGLRGLQSAGNGQTAPQQTPSPDGLKRRDIVTRPSRAEGWRAEAHRLDLSTRETPMTSPA
jgi:hypothetical protein